MADNMILIMVDECGDEVEVNRFTIGNELDEDYIEMWQDMKIAKARESYPEAQRFYFEDRRNWNAQINAMVRGDEYYDAWEDEEEPNDYNLEEEYSQNAPCDNSGFCTGQGCPFFFTCVG